MWRSCVVLILVMSGCAAPPSLPPQPSLEPEWSKCRWEYPDGTPLDCDGNAVPLVSLAQRGPEWVCVFRANFGASHFEISRSVVDNAMAIDVGLEQNRHARGIALLESEGGSHLVNWSFPRSAGFGRLPTAFPVTGQLTYLLYWNEFRTDHPALLNATVEQSWQVHSQNLTAVHHVDVGEARLLFHKYQRLPFAGWSGFATFTQDLGHNRSATFDMNPVLAREGAAFNAALPSDSCVEPTAFAGFSLQVAA